MIVTFCGHGDYNYSDEIRLKLRNTIIDLINNGADKFLLGGYGSFDMISAHLIYELKADFPDIMSVLVIPYLNRKYDMDWYDTSIYPPIENTPKRYAIIKRNYWIVDKADVLIAFVKYDFGGAYKTFSYAKRKKKHIINLYNEV